MGPLPEGFVYQPEFLTAEEERALAGGIARLEFSPVRMRGVTARRRVIHYGLVYAYESFRLTPGPPVPDFLAPFRDRVACVAGVEPETIGEALITEYSPGAVIGWHRDAPAFAIVIALSLLGACRFRFRRGEGAARETAEIEVAPRSLYILAGPARSEWQHSIPAVKALRYSITFRTLRNRRRTSEK